MYNLYILALKKNFFREGGGTNGPSPYLHFKGTRRKCSKVKNEESRSFLGYLEQSFISQHPAKMLLCALKVSFYNVFLLVKEYHFKSLKRTQPRELDGILIFFYFSP